jgi:hypothetical protein
MLKLTKGLMIGLTLSTVISGFAYSAVQGIVGVTSQGSVVINASKGNSVRISGLTDLFFPGSANAPAPLSQTACIYATTGSYTIQATSANTLNNQFRLKDATTDYITSTVGWANVAAGGTANLLNSGIASSGLTGANTTSSTCNGTANANFQVSIDAPTFNAAPAGSYTDTLTLIVAPV